MPEWVLLLIVWCLLSLLVGIGLARWFRAMHDADVREG
jgi:hypothetical protein